MKRGPAISAGNVPQQTAPYSGNIVAPEAIPPGTTQPNSPQPNNAPAAATSPQPMLPSGAPLDFGMNNTPLATLPLKRDLTTAPPTAIQLPQVNPAAIPAPQQPAPLLMRDSLLPYQPTPQAKLVPVSPQVTILPTTVPRVLHQESPLSPVSPQAAVQNPTPATTPLLMRESLLPYQPSPEASIPASMPVVQPVQYLMPVNTTGVLPPNNAATPINPPPFFAPSTLMAPAPMQPSSNSMLLRDSLVPYQQ